MQKFVLFTLLTAVTLTACAPSGSASTEATVIALSVQLTIAAQTQAPAATEGTVAPTVQPTVAPTLASTEAHTPEPAEPAAEEPFEVLGTKAPRFTQSSTYYARTDTTSPRTASLARRPARKCAISRSPKASAPTASSAR